MVFRLSGGTESPHGAAMKAVDHGDDLVAPGLAAQSSQLDGRLVRLGPTVAKETLAAPSGALAERLGKQPLRLCIPRVRDVKQLTGLVSNGIHYSGGTVA